MIGILNESIKRWTRQTPARLPYSYTDSTARSRYCGSIAYGISASAASLRPSPSTTLEISEPSSQLSTMLSATRAPLGQVTFGT